MAENSVSIVLYLSDGSINKIESTIDSDATESFINWMRDEKSSKVWTWIHPNTSSMVMVSKHHIVAVEIHGYIDPDGRDSKWYEIWMDKIRTKRIMKI